MHILFFFCIFAPEFVFTMKRINVRIDTFYGYGCNGCAYSSEGSEQLQIEDHIADILRKLLTEVPDVDEETGKKGIDKDHIRKAMVDGYEELLPLYESLIQLGREQMAAYWILEADNDCLDETLQPAFFQDIEDGLYTPEVSLEEFGEDRDNDYYYEYKDDYLAWVENHFDEDCDFVADRKGIDVSDIFQGEADDEISFFIFDIED